MLMRRFFSSGAASSPLKAALASKIPQHQERVKAVKAAHGDKILGKCTVDQAYGGMRSVGSMVWEPSLLDAEEGIRYRGLSIPECQAKLPAFVPGGEPMPESLLWLLMTGEVPTEAEAKSVVEDLQHRAKLPASAERVIDGLDKGLHPMSQLCIGVLACQQDSHFAKAYASGVRKNEYWETTYEDTMNLLARLPLIASRVYRNVYNKKGADRHEPGQDLSGAFSAMLGKGDNEKFAELMRLYLVVHADHEGGNVSAHAVHLVGSALSDAYLSFAGGMTGLAGPLHGLANQEVLTWLKDAQSKLPAEPSDADVEQFIIDTLKSGRVVPGYGHAVLRKTDPRFMAQREFALKHLPDDKLFKLVSQMYEIAPRVLKEKAPKIANPFPNVDAHSGCLLQHYDLKEENFYTVMFGVSRAIGVLTQLVWSRALGLPLERPKSYTTEAIEKMFQK